jgi:hypothetical protein
MWVFYIQQNKKFPIGSSLFNKQKVITDFGWNGPVKGTLLLTWLKYPSCLSKGKKQEGLSPAFLFVSKS